VLWWFRGAAVFSCVRSVRGSDDAVRLCLGGANLRSMRLDLRTGRTVWHPERLKVPTCSTVKRDIATDVLVVGAGVTGALLARTFVDLGREVVIVDSRAPAKGSTAASTAILSYEADTNLVELIRMKGERAAIRAYQMGVEAIDLLEQVTRELDDHADFRRRRSIYLASSKGDVNLIGREFRTRKRCGFDVELVGRAELERFFMVRSPAGILNRVAAEIDPVRFTLALIRHVQKRGGAVYKDARVRRFEHGRKRSTVTLENGRKISAKVVVFATGYETQSVLRQPTVRLVSSYAIASKPGVTFPAGFESAVLWESARPYLYARMTADGRIVAGGEDVDFSDDEARDRLLPSKTVVLERKMRRLMPNLKWELEDAWTGTFGQSQDGLPYIGRNPRYPGAFFALGYGGNGITFSAVASRIIPDLVAGKNNRDAEICKFGRRTR
jgi:glycine/D-amino acid oxidase-like deaminating enzyme